MVHAIKQAALVIDQNQARTQLELLGYQPGDNIYMRFFVPDGDPRFGTPAAARKANKLNWQEVEHYQNDGYGVYFVVNGGGHTDKEVTVGRSLFCEWDDRPIEDQIYAWQGLNLLEPSMQVGTRKSVHNYWRADLTKDQWLELQEDLLAYTQSDQKLKNPSRVLRLAGAYHIKPGCEPVRCDIIHQSDKVYTYEELRSIIPHKTHPERSNINYQPSISDDVPLYQFLTKDDRALIDSGVGQGSRNDSGAKLARNLIGTTERLNYLGIRYSGDSRQLFNNYCHRCSPEIADKEAETIWKSAQKNNPTPSLSDDALENCAKAWVRNQQKASGRGYSSGIGSGRGNRRGGSGSGGGGDDGDGGDSNVVNFPGFDPLSSEDITQEIDSLISKGVTGSRLTERLNRIAANHQIYVKELWKFYYERVGEVDVEGDRDTNRDEVDNLLKLADQSLDLADYLPGALANPLTNWCSWLSIRPAVALTALLAGASSLHKVGTELVIHRNKNFEVPPTLYSALVGDSGQLKSPVLSNIIRQPLNKLRQEKVEAHKAALEDYEVAMQAWAESEEGEKPIKPADPTLYFFTQYTGESIPTQTGKAPDKALLAAIDEISGLFKSENSYRGGRGSDKQDLLSYFDGTGQTVLRASGVKVDVERIYLSIFGTIQPEVLKSHMTDCSDPDGQWARFLFVNQPLAFAPLGDDDGQAVSIRDRIADFYRQIERIPEMEYRLSRAAFKRYQPMHDELERLRLTHAKPGMRAVYSKMKGIIGRLALNLHVLWELDAGKACPDEEIPLFIMEMAIALAKFYIGQIKLIHADSDHESLPAHIVKLIELSKRLDSNGKGGWIKAQQYSQQFQPKNRPSAQKARNWMNEAVTLGHGRTRGTGNRLEYHWLRDNNSPPTTPDNLGMLGIVRDDLGMVHPGVESIENKGVEGNLGMLGMGITNSSPTQSNGSPPEEKSLQPLLEGGYHPEVSLTNPQESCDLGLVSNTDLGNNLGMGIPKYPEVSLTEKDASAPEQKAVVEAIAPTACIITTPVENAPQPVEAVTDIETPQPVDQVTSSQVTDGSNVESDVAASAAPALRDIPQRPKYEVGDRVVIQAGGGRFDGHGATITDCSDLGEIAVETDNGLKLCFPAGYLVFVGDEIEDEF